MIRRRALLIITAVTAILLFAVLNHRQHKVLELSSTSTSGEPTRIVSLAPNLTEILFALGLGENVVAVSNNCDWPAEAVSRKKVGTFWQPNTEAIIASRPDLVITLWFEQQKAVADTLSRLGYEVLTLKIDEIGELFTAIQKMGEAIGRTEHAEKLAENIRKKINDLQSKYSSTNKVRTLWVVQVEPLRIAGRSTFVNEMIEFAGGENAIGPTIGQYPQIGTEELLACGAEVIIQSAMGADNIDRQQQAAELFWSKLAALPAVKNNRIYVVNPDTVLRLGPRLPEGIEIIARCLHPATATQKHDVALQTR